MFWAIVKESRLIDFETGDTPEEAIKTYVKRKVVSEEDIPLLVAIDAKKLRDDVIVVPRWLILALEHELEFALGSQESFPPPYSGWKPKEARKYYMGIVETINRHGIKPEDIVGWVKVSPIFDEWAPVVK